MKDFQFLQQKFIVNTYPNRGITLIKGSGMYLYDAEGTAYLDLMSNYGVSIFGHSHPAITNALTQQLKRLTSLHGSFNNDIRSLAAQAIIKKTGAFSQLYFSNSGAEAIEAALKFTMLAAKFTDGSHSRGKILAAEHSYHGKTLGALSLTSGEKYRKPFEPFGLEVGFIPYNDVEAFNTAADKQTLAFVIEPVQGEGGLTSPKKGYLRQIKKLCEQKNILLVFDEIQSGTGRTGKFLASQWDGVEPDILCLGKGLAGGMPVGATLVNQRVSSKIPRNIHTSTFGGNPLTCAGILATLELLDSRRLQHIQDMGNYFTHSLEHIASDLFGEVKGKGLMLGITVRNNNRNTVLRLLQQNKILAIPAGDDVVRFLPPYIIERKHIDTVVGTLQKIAANL